MSDFDLNLSDIYSAGAKPAATDQARGEKLFQAIDANLRRQAEVDAAIQEALPHHLYEEAKSLKEDEKGLRNAVREFLLDFLPDGGGKFTWRGGSLVFTKTKPKYTPNPDCVKNPEILKMLRRAEVELEKELVVPTIQARYLEECFTRGILDVQAMVRAGAVDVKQNMPQVRIKFTG